MSLFIYTREEASMNWNFKVKAVFSASRTRDKSPCSPVLLSGETTGVVPLWLWYQCSTLAPGEFIRGPSVFSAVQSPVKDPGALLERQE